MKLNFVFDAPFGYEPPISSSPFYTPEDLAALLIYDRSFVSRTQGEGATPPISEAGIKRLVNLVFYSSSYPDEGRFPRFKVSTGSVFQVAEFVAVPLDSPNALRRLAPACTHPECALRVVECEEGTLACDGVVNLGPMGLEWTPGYPGVSAVGNMPMYQLTVRDPGHILATACHASFELRAGNIRRLSPYLRLDPVVAFHDDFVRRLKTQITHAADDDAAKLFGGVERYTWPDGFHNIFTRILRVAVEARHGGAFVVLPESTRLEDCPINLRYRASDLDLGQKAVDFWLACTAYSRSEKNHQSLLQRCNAARTKMLVDAKAVGNLSAVDGCVMLDRQLHVLGFGGVITISEKDAKQSNSPFRNVVSGQEWPYDEFMKGVGGTRHQSAARLCRVLPGALVFVVSQDGDLKLLCSNKGPPQVNGYGPLDLPAFDDART